MSGVKTAGFRAQGCSRPAGIGVRDRRARRAVPDPHPPQQGDRGQDRQPGQDQDDDDLERVDRRIPHAGDMIVTVRARVRLPGEHRGDAHQQRGDRDQGQTAQCPRASRASSRIEHPSSAAAAIC
ncbi:hypothetical protein, partial [Paractinoplanes toevensis]|uniref:hypothetical protein n=1 Tax=Paractinoplanes toevensis TaxID=571911 RepID=UPI001BB30B94